MPSASKTSSKKNRAKTVFKKSTAEKEGVKIKYADKSGGQPQLIPIFDEIKNMLAPYEKGTMKLLAESKGNVVLVSKKPVEILGRKRDELWFASALIQKGYVGFYYMPVYMDSEIRKLIKPGLLKCLKGRACFHIKKFDKEIFSQINDALKIGYDCWHMRGWL